jgi:probable F420-dependent oxidoreductase
MRRFDFSLHLHGDRAQNARKFEALGLDSVHSGEHLLFHHGGSMNAMIALAAAAAVTTRIRLVTTITYAPLYPPAILAWLATSLDHISNGRFEMGIGVGGEYPPAFELAGIDVHERGARTDESLAMIRQLWSGEKTTFEGRFNRFHDIRWTPLPVQARLPIWIGGRKEAAMRRAARFGDGWMPYMYSVERMADSVRVVRDEAERLGRDPESIKMGILLFVTVYRDGEKAKRVAAETVSSGYNQDLRHTVDRYLVAGTPDECRARMRGYFDAGARSAFITLRCPAEDTDEMVDLLVSEVLPEFRPAGVAAG